MPILVQYWVPMTKSGQNVNIPIMDEYFMSILVQYWLQILTEYIEIVNTLILDQYFMPKLKQCYKYWLNIGKMQTPQYWVSNTLQ